MKVSQKQFAEALYLASKSGTNRQNILKQTKSLIVKYQLSKQKRQIIEILQNIEEKLSTRKTFYIKTSHHLSAKELDKIREYLVTQTTKEIVIKQIIEPTLTGIIVQSRYYEFNNSIDHKLQQLIKNS